MNWLFETTPWGEYGQGMFIFTNIVNGISAVVLGLCALVLWNFKKIELSYPKTWILLGVYLSTLGASNVTHALGFTYGYHRLVLVVDIISFVVACTSMILIPYVVVAWVRVPVPALVDQLIHDKACVINERDTLKQVLRRKEQVIQILAKKVTELQTQNTVLADSRPLSEITEQIEELEKRVKDNGFD